MSNIHLYDITAGDFPLGTVFRTLQVFKCRHCGSLTNETWWANCFMGGARVECPNEKQSWHQRIEGLRHKGLFEERPKSYEAMVEQEVAELLRANPRVNDLLGNPILDWFANAVMHDGYVIDGVGFGPNGEKRLPIGTGYSGASPSFQDAPFQIAIKDLPPKMAELMRRRIISAHALEEIIRDSRTEKASEEASRLSGWLEIGTELRAVGVEMSAIPGSQKMWLDFYGRYLRAYGQWEAEQYLKTHGRRTCHSGG